MAAVSDVEQLRSVVLSWPRPERWDLALSAVEALARTREQLAAVVNGVPDRQLRSAVAGVVSSAGFVLDYWPDALARIEPGEWSLAQTQALTADLAQIALSGALALDRIRELSAVPPAGVAENSAAIPSVSTAGVTRGSAHAAERQVSKRGHSRWTAVAAGFADGPARRSLAVMWATGAASLVLAAAWYLRYDVAPATALHPAPGQARGTPAESKAAAPATARTSNTPAFPSATDTTPVTSIQIQFLGSSAQVPQIVVDRLIDTDSTGAFRLRVTWGRTGQLPTGTAIRVISGATSYELTMPIAAADLCGSPVTVEALAGAVSASTSTAAGPCPSGAPPITTS